MLKRFFKELRRAKYPETPVFLRALWTDYFQGVFDQKEFCDAFACDDVFAESVSLRLANQDPGDGGAQKDQHGLHQQGPEEPGL